MTFEEFSRLEPGTWVLLDGCTVLYVRPARHHPMAARLSELSGLPITPTPPASVISRLRDAYRDVRVYDHESGDYRKMTDAEILADESKSEPFAYYTAVVLDTAEEREVSPERLEHA